MSTHEARAALVLLNYFNENSFEDEAFSRAMWQRLHPALTTLECAGQLRPTNQTNLDARWQFSKDRLFLQGKTTDDSLSVDICLQNSDLAPTVGTALIQINT